MKSLNKIQNPLIIVLVGLIGLFSCSQDDTIDRLGNEGVVLFESGNINGALSKFEEIIKLDSQISEAHLRKADCLDLLGDISGSIKSYSKAIQMEPNNKIAIYNRALSYEKVGMYENTILDYNLAISIDRPNELEPNNKTIFNNLGILYGERNQLDSSIYAFTRAIEIDNKYADAYHNRGYAFQIKKENLKAVEDFKRALEEDPNNTIYQNSMNKSLGSLE